MDDESVYYDRLEKKLLKNDRRFKLIDLFAGAGGLTLGFTEIFGHPFKSVWANDFNKYAASTYNLNFGVHCLTEDIVDLLNDSKTHIPPADVVIG